MNTFEGKTVLVTGAASGIGREIALQYAKAGARVITFDLESVDLEEYSDRVEEYKIDLRDAEELTGFLNRVFEVYGDLDIIINNAGVSIFKSLVDVETWEFDSIMNTNLRPMFIIGREFARHRQDNKKKWGSIVNIASTRAFMSEPGTEAYSASKGGIVALTHALAASFAEYNINVNSISPGWIETKNYGSLSPQNHTQHFSGRVGKPIDIANVCMFLTDGENGFIDGENIVVDGGMTRKMIYV